MYLLSDLPIVIAAYRHVLRVLRSVRHYPYHNTGHTLDVFKRARELAHAEGVSREDTEDILLASLFHDTGFVVSYTKNEEIGANMARDWLIENGHPKERVDHVVSLILATVPFVPVKTLLEKIIQDADLDNLWRDDCFSKMEKVEEELKSMLGLDTKTIYWIFRKLHHDYRFQTPTSIRQRQAKKLRNMIRFDKKYARLIAD